MKLKELVGLYAIRSKIAKLPAGGICASFTTEPIRIEKVTATHCYYSYPPTMTTFYENRKIRVLPLYAMDDNWALFDPPVVS